MRPAGRARRWAAALAGGLVLAAAGPAGAGAARIGIYAALDEKVVTELVHAFRAQAGVEADLLAVAAAGTLAARIKGDKAERADVLLGGSADAHAALAADGLLVPYRSPALAEARLNPAFADPAAHWSGWYLGALTIAVHRERFQRSLAPRGLRLPRTWEDLLHPAYRGHLTLPSPVTTTAGYLFLATQVFRLGQERAFEYLRRLVANAAQVAPTAPLPIQQVARGEAVATVAWGHDALAARQQGAPLEMISPPDTGVEVGAVSILRGGANPEGARAFVDFLLGRGAQEIHARLDFRYPARPDAAGPAGAPPLATLKLVRFDREWAAQNRERLLRRWQAEVQK